FGDLESVVYLSEIIARRQGIGDVLAEGVKVAADRFGKDSQRYAIQIKGLEQSGYEARWAPAMMLAYMTADVGAHHNRAWAITHDVAVGRDQIEGKAAKVIELQHIRPLFDALGICRLQWVELGFELYHYEEMFKAVTGVDYSWAELLKISERIFNLTRMFWIKHMPGFGRSWDYPPARMIEEETPTGPSKGKRIPLEDLDRLLDDYYTQRGWSLEGIPTKEKLEELGLGDLAVALPTQTAAR
ncbi:MAG: aldehyde ferredoxin oxidoreductase C-terminal domain-containing protein, partial [Bacillota bacterium]